MYAMSTTDSRQRSRPSDSSNPAQPKSKQIDSQQLFGGADTLHIEHRGVIYTLRETRNGKLILNK